MTNISEQSMSNVEWQAEVLALRAAQSSGRQRLDLTHELGNLLIGAYGWYPSWAYAEASERVAQFAWWLALSSLNEPAMRR